MMIVNLNTMWHWHAVMNSTTERELNWAGFLQTVTEGTCLWTEYCVSQCFLNSEAASLTDVCFAGMQLLIAIYGGYCPVLYKNYDIPHIAAVHWVDVSSLSVFICRQLFGVHWMTLPLNHVTGDGSTVMDSWCLKKLMDLLHQTLYWMLSAADARVIVLQVCVPVKRMAFIVWQPVASVMELNVRMLLQLL